MTKMFHFLSAAHCFQYKKIAEKLSPGYVNVLLGKHDLTADNERGSVKKSVYEIVIHPDWDFNSEKFDADIAIVVLYEAVEFTSKIQPVCLPGISYKDVTGVGTVVGWGKSEHSGGEAYSPRPSAVNIPAVNGTHCYTTEDQLAMVSSNRAFCAGHVQRGISPCLGDSGSGFYISNPASEHFHVEGIVSVAIHDDERGCDINKFSLYTNVSWFLNWIRKVMGETVEISWKFVDFEPVLGYYQ